METNISHPLGFSRELREVSQYIIWNINVSEDSLNVTLNSVYKKCNGKRSFVSFIQGNVKLTKKGEKRFITSSFHFHYYDRT